MVQDDRYQPYYANAGEAAASAPENQTVTKEMIRKCEKKHFGVLERLDGNPYWQKRSM